MSNSEPLAHNHIRGAYKQNCGDADDTGVNKVDRLPNQEGAGSTQRQTRKRTSNRGLFGLRKAQSTVSSDRVDGSPQTADHFYTPAEFHAMVLGEFKINCLESDISRVRIVSATFYRYGSGASSIRLELQGDLGRFTRSHVLTLHPSPPSDPVRTRRLGFKLPGTKNTQRAQVLDSATYATVGASDQGASHPSDPEVGELFSNGNPSDARFSDNTSINSSTAEFQSVASSPVLISPTIQTFYLTDDTLPTQSKPSAARFVSPHNPSPALNDPSVTPCGHGSVITSQPGCSRHHMGSADHLTARGGMDILPNNTPTKATSRDAYNTISPSHPANSSPDTYYPTVLAPSNRNAASITRASDKPVPTGFLTSSPSTKSPDVAHTRSDPRTNRTNSTDDYGLATRNLLAAPLSAKRGRSNSVGPNNIGVLASQNTGADISLVVAPLLKPPRSTVKQQMTGAATGAFRACSRTVVDLKANVRPKPRTGRFRLVSAEQVDTYSSRMIQGATAVKELPAGNKLLTLEDVVVLASTIASRASHHTQATHSESWYLDAMWRGFHLIIGSEQIEDDREVVTAAAEELSKDVMARFSGEVTKFRRGIAQIREAEDPRGVKRQALQTKMQQDIDRFNKEIDEKIKATDALAKENKELEMEMKLLKQKLESDSEAPDDLVSRVPY
ncbi:hypothetical protein FRC12_023923 [Ceratobasidium sp. 428]|nr:hypothetical protein FRC12_023923 [Ceratobasidium sp. 428]